MKRNLVLLVVTLICLVVLSGCFCEHEWTEADCLTSKTCTQCNKTEGDALGHDFVPATCVDPEICARCKQEEGNALGHDWAPATCETPENCTNCGETKGEKLEHVYGDWSISETKMSKSCNYCGTGTTYYFIQDMNPENFEKLKMAPDLIIGTWEATDSSVYYFDSTGYTLTAFEDGTYTAAMEEPSEGKWEFCDYDPELGYGYSFTENTTGFLSIIPIHYISEDGVLTCLVDWIDDNGQNITIAVYMEKK